MTSAAIAKCSITEELDRLIELNRDLLLAVRNADWSRCATLQQSRDHAYRRLFANAESANILKTLQTKLTQLWALDQQVLNSVKSEHQNSRKEALKVQQGRQVKELYSKF